ncbi:PREDICTED: ubiA prenyltransferase domain-containing protein 1 homolog [Papilio xuthus]|uniref:UbiA prenyltransferase domain-containing protein 1 homolog n=1 Tax=Papilio xuthus TaxID=66420 RepID=A0AAJ6ZVB3_PAPXU|nr:PREDICTED: ubiA prenyltransferase domain-containing protein 1 homolog [Papilio xuthus]
MKTNKKTDNDITAAEGNLLQPPNEEVSSSRNPLMKVRTYVVALRPWSLSGSLLPTLLGAALSYRLPGESGFSWVTLLLTLCTVVPVHGAGNVVNTYFDFVKGIDNRKSDDRTLVDRLLSIDEVVSLGALLYMAGCAFFLLLVILSPARMEHLALVYFGGLSSSFLYTGGIGLKYIALGDIVVLVIFGPVAVVFSFLAQTGRVDWPIIYYAIPLALNTEAILHSNNTRDLEIDSKAEIVTLAILIGKTASYLLYAFLLFTPYIMFVVASVRCSLWFLLPMLTLPRAFDIERRFRCLDTMQYVPRQTARLNFYFGMLYIISCLFANRLPFLLRQ